MFNFLQRRAEEKKRKARQEQLLTQLSSGALTLAREALREMKQQGWVTQSDSILKGASLVGLNLGATRIGEVNFEKADLTNAIFTKADLMKANFTRAVLNHADLSQAKIWNALFIGAQLRGCNLQNAELVKSSLKNADLQEADMRHAALYEASFYGANLTRASLQDAQLWAADLRGANLTNAQLVGAKLFDEFFGNAIFDETTILPDGSNWLPEADLQRFVDYETVRDLELKAIIQEARKKLKKTPFLNTLEFEVIQAEKETVTDELSSLDDQLVADPTPSSIHHPLDEVDIETLSDEDLKQIFVTVREQLGSSPFLTTDEFKALQLSEEASHPYTDQRSITDGHLMPVVDTSLFDDELSAAANLYWQGIASQNTPTETFEVLPHNEGSFWANQIRTQVLPSAINQPAPKARDATQPTNQRFDYPAPKMDGVFRRDSSSTQPSRRSNAQNIDPNPSSE
ncbi:MAG: pentapeptide repeat-containing protein [Phototrophicaceae bacterium]